MTPFRLNRQIVLEDPARVPDDAGGFTVVWQALGTHWAHIAPGTGREKAAHNLPRSHVPLRITVRAAPVDAPSRPKPGQRFREGARIFNINAVTERDQTGRYLLCHAQEEVAT